MKFFQNRAVATVIAMVVVVASSLLSSYVGMNRDLSKVNMSFWKVDGKAPVYYVDQQIGAAASLATVGEHYSDLTGSASAVREARTALVNAENVHEISGVYNASVRLADAVSDLEQAASGTSLSAADASTFSDGINTVSGSMRQLLESDYNSSVQKLLRSNYLSFPGAVFASVLDIDEPVPFGP